VASDHGGGLDRVTIWVHVLAGLLFLAWSAVFFYSLWRFRATRQESSENQEESLKHRWPMWVEVTVVAAEAVILIGLSIPLFSARLGETIEDDAVEVRIVAQQYAWNVHYPGPDGEFGTTEPSLVDEEINPVGLDRNDPRAADDLVLVNQLHLPVDRVAVLRMSSKDVIHGFSIVEMRVKRDVVPGSITTIAFRPTVTSEEMGRRLGLDDPSTYVYEIACAQLCGLGHSRMRGFLVVHDQESFEAWKSAEQEKQGEPVDDFWQ
ncbi:MAG: hypothetical protein MPN21_17640, partial [Thermoanaerobaculia bacterium]|nr:hypothetical protein [Thermoanaerobaculia bacterium]